VRTGTVPNRCAANNHDGLPLHGMPTNECQRILSECSDSERSVSSYSRGAGYRRPSRSDLALFLSVLHDLDVYSTRTAISSSRHTTSKMSHYFTNGQVFTDPML
jgi:hypothetical protein